MTKKTRISLFILGFIISVGISSSTSLSQSLFTNVEDPITFFNKSNNNLTPRTNLDNVSKIFESSEESGQIRNSEFLYNSHNEIFIIWQQDISQHNSKIFITEYSIDFEPVGSEKVIIDVDDYSSINKKFHFSTVILDSTDNFHLFWFVFTVSTQTNEIYHQKIDSNFDNLVSAHVAYSFKNSAFSSIGYDYIYRIQIDKFDNFHILLRTNEIILLNDMGGEIVNNFIGTSIESQNDIAIVDFVINKHINMGYILTRQREEKLIYCFPYSYSDTNVELNEEILFYNYTEIPIYPLQFLEINSTILFYGVLHGEEDENIVYLMTSKGNLSDFIEIHPFFYHQETLRKFHLYSNATHSVSLSFNYTSFDNTKVYFKLHSNFKNNTEIDQVLLFEFPKNESKFWYPSPSFCNIHEQDGVLVLGIHLGVGDATDQLFLWKCSLSGENFHNPVFIAPIKYEEYIPGYGLIGLIIIAFAEIGILLYKKKKVKSSK